MVISTRLTGILAIILSLALSGCGKDKEKSTYSREITAGAKAPFFTARDPENKYRSPSDFAGKVTLITFWRKKCKDCVDGLDMIEKLYQRLGDKRFEVMAINGDNLDYVPSHKIWEFVKGRGYSFTVLLDDRFSAIEKYRIINIPASFLIDRSGVVSFVKHGEYDWLSQESVSRIEDLLG